MTNYYIKGRNNKWIRPAGWPTLPTVTTAENRIVGLYAVYNKPHNKVGIAVGGTSLNVTVNWGDTTSSTITSTTTEAKDYDDYASLPGLIYTDEYGDPYKIVTVEIIFNSGTFTSINLASRASGTNWTANQWLELVVSSTTYPFFTIRPTLLQSLKIIKATWTGNFSSSLTNWVRLEDFEFVGDFAGATTILNMMTGLGKVNLGDITFTRATSTNAVSLFSGGNILSVGNVTLNNFNNCGSLFSGCQLLERVGNITLPNSTNISTMFNGCTFLKKVGTITPSATDQAATSMFNGCLMLKEVIFSDASMINATTTMFQSCSMLEKVRLPGISISFSLSDCNMERAEMIDLFNDLASVTPGSQTLTILRNPAVDDLTAADYLIATSKGWLVSN
jgi:hypothetical protein